MILEGITEEDARIDSSRSVVKYQPQWADAIYALLANKRSNIQFGVELELDYGCTRVRSRKAIELFADSWKAMKPLLSFAVEE